MGFECALSAPQVVVRLTTYGVSAKMLLHLSPTVRAITLATGAGRERCCTLENARDRVATPADCMQLCRSVVAAGAALDVDFHLLEFWAFSPECVAALRDLAVPVRFRCDRQMTHWPETYALINEFGMKVRSVIVDRVAYRAGLSQERSACQLLAECVAQHAETMTTLRLEPSMRSLPLHECTTPVLSRLPHLRAFYSWFTEIPSLQEVLEALPASSLVELGLEYPGSDPDWLPRVGRLTALQKLRIVGADFENLRAQDCSGTFVRLRALKQLNIICCELQDDAAAVVVRELTGSRLESLDLEANMLAELSCEALNACSLPRLRHLDLSANEVDFDEAALVAALRSCAPAQCA